MHGHGYGAEPVGPPFKDNGNPTGPHRRASVPDLSRLRCIAVAVLGGRPGRPALGVTADDLVAAGWLGYVEAGPLARTASYPYARARWAMLDELRRWYGPLNAVPLALTLAAPDPDHSPRLTPEQATDLTAFCGRHLGGRRERLMIGLLVDGESLDRMADRLGWTPQQAMVARAQAITRLRAAVAA